MDEINNVRLKQILHMNNCEWSEQKVQEIREEEYVNALEIYHGA